MPDGTDNWNREFHQRNCIERGLKLVPNLKNDDIILISDVDEIIRSETIIQLRKDEISKMYNLGDKDKCNCGIDLSFKTCPSITSIIHP